MDNNQQYNQTDKYDRLDLNVPLSSNQELDPDFYGDAGLFDVPGIARKMRPENSLQQAEPQLADKSAQRQQAEQQNSGQPQAGPPLGPPLGPQGRSQTGSLTDENENGCNDQAMQQEAENIRQFGETQLPQSKSNIHVLSIVGEIEGHIVLPPQNKTTKYEHIIPQLVALEQDDEIEGTIILLNTVGGDVEAGLAIAEMIASMSKPTVSIVLGGGHSIGVPIAVAADYSFITATASMTVHPIRLNGMVIGVPQTYEYLDKMQDRVVSFVVNHSNISEKTFRELMFRTGELARDIGTVLIGQEAVQTGLIDDVGGLGSAVAMLRQLIARQREAGVYQ